MNLIKYRKDIDGLRAISVVSVIIYHFQFNIFGFDILKGGFLGVDIFFVISGYLITKIIIKEIKNGNLSIITFYERRMRRILPVLFLVIFIFFFISYFLLFYGHFVEYAETALWSIFFSSNVYFVLNNLFYGSLDNSLKPLLHTWSLSVEEQFYLFYPIILVIIYKFFKKNFIFFTVIGILSSLLLTEYFHKSNIYTFYLIPFRGWELLFGGLLVYIERRVAVSSLVHNFSFLIIIFFLFVFDKFKFNHPSFWTLIPVLSTCVILLNRNENTFTYRILSQKNIIFIGLISYSLYLWHYPIISFANYRTLDEPSILIKFLLILLIFCISCLSYYYVEIIFRDKKKIPSNNFFLIIIFFFLCLISLSIVSIKKIKSYNINKSIAGIFLDNTVFSLSTEKFRKEYNIKFEDTFDKKNILIVGDSHADDLFRIFFLSKYKYPGYNFSLMMGDFYCFSMFVKEQHTKCGDVYLKQKSKDIFLEDILKSNFIIISTQWEDRDFEELPFIVKWAELNSKTLVITSNTPEFKTFLAFGNSTILDNYLMKNKNILKDNKLNYIQKSSLEEIYFQNIKKEVFEINKKLKHISQKYNLKYLDKFDYICNRELKKCNVLTPGGQKIFYDYGHYTLEGSKYFSEKIFKMNWLNLR